MHRRVRVLVALATAIAGVVFVTTLVRATVWAPENEMASSTLAALAPARDAEPGDLPSRLTIPSLGIDAHIKHVGVNTEGNMATPGTFVDTGWYKYGTVPGFLGSAVIDGHVDNALGQDGVFKHLDSLKPGDYIYVKTASSTELRFIVREVASYPAAEVPTDRLFNAKDRVRLNLITCTGAWLKSTNQYAERLVVYAELAP